MYKATLGDRTFSVETKDGKTSIDGKEFNADVLEYKAGQFHILLNNKSYSAEVLSIDRIAKTVLIKIGNKEITVSLKNKYDELLQEIGIDLTAATKVKDINAPMPGMVLQIMVESGQHIKKGDAIVVLEAMKMENILKSPADGIVKKVHVIKGDKVEKNQVMVNLD